MANTLNSIQPGELPSSFENLATTTKNTIFGTISVLLKDSNMPKWLIYISLFIETFQIAGFSFTLTVYPSTGQLPMECWRNYQNYGLHSWCFPYGGMAWKNDIQNIFDPFLFSCPPCCVGYHWLHVCCHIILQKQICMHLAT